MEIDAPNVTAASSAPSVAKRARVGRPATSLLAAIEADTSADSGATQLRGLLLQAGQRRQKAPTDNAEAAEIPSQESLLEALLAQSFSLAGKLSSESDLRTEAINVLLECIESLPSHTPVFAVLCALFVGYGSDNSDTPNSMSGISLLQLVVDAVVTRLTRRLNSKDGNKCIAARLLLRFLASLGACGMISAASFLQQCTELLNSADQAGAESSAHYFLAYAVASALPFFANPSDAPLASVGAGDPTLATPLTHLISRLQTYITTANKAFHSNTGGDNAVSVLARSIDTMWLDIPAAQGDEAARTSLFPMTSPVATLSVLVTALSDAAMKGPSFSSLAPCSIARPCDDVEVAAYVMQLAQTAGSGTDSASKSTALPITFVPVVHIRNGAVTSTLQFAQNGISHGYDNNDSKNNAMISEWFVRPAVNIFGVGGLSATPAVMRVLKLDRIETATPLSIWALREVAHDVILTYYPLHEAAADALRHLPMRAEIDRNDIVRSLRNPNDDGNVSTEMTNASTGNPTYPTTQRYTLLSAALPLAVESVLTQVLWPSGPPLPQTYYSVLMLDLFAGDALLNSSTETTSNNGVTQNTTTASSASQVLGLAARVLWKNAAVVDESILLTRLAPWLAHHISNKQWDWMWSDWALSITAAPTPLTQSALSQQRLLVALLAHTFALIGPWHYDRIIAQQFTGAFSSQMNVLYPKITDAGSSVLLPHVKVKSEPMTAEGTVDVNVDDANVTTVAAVNTTSDDTIMATPSKSATEFQPPSALLALARETLAQLQAKIDAKALRVWMNTAPIALSVPAEERLLQLAHCIFMHGRSNLRNAGVLLDRYHDALTTTNDFEITQPRLPFIVRDAAGDDVRAHLLFSAVHQVWHRAPHVAIILCSELVSRRIASASQLVSFALDPIVRFPHTHYLHIRSPNSSQGKNNGNEGVSPIRRSNVVIDGSGPNPNREDADDGTLTDAATPWPAVEEAHETKAALSSYLDSIAADQPGHHFIHRALSSHCWELLFATLDQVVAIAHAAATDLALFRGAKVYDAERDDELTVEGATKVESDLVQRVREAIQTRDAAVCAAFANCIKLGRSIHGFIMTGSAGEESIIATEALRITQSQLRRCGRSYPLLLRRPTVIKAVTSALEHTSHFLTALKSNTHHTATASDTIGQLALALITAYKPVRLNFTSALLRDSCAPPMDFDALES